jgi:DNA methylase
MPDSKQQRSDHPLKRLKANDSISVEYSTKYGAALVGQSEILLAGDLGRELAGKVQLVFSSPPFPLNRKKKYGNLEGPKFKAWLEGYAQVLRNLLTRDGSIVLEMGNAWEPRLPVMSTLAMETLLTFKAAAKLHLCQEFIWFNNAKLPTPAQWVTVKRYRVKDAFTRLWWMSPTPYPKADARRVLAPYSRSMRSLLRTGKYNSGKRPSEHVIGAKSFLTDHGGAIPPNVLTMKSEKELLSESLNNVLVGANTESGDSYQRYCRLTSQMPHPARMPVELANFFINLCTDPNDLVFDPFAGSNTTGASAEQLGRRWLTVEANRIYAAAGIGRFPKLWDEDELRNVRQEAASDG